MTQWGLDVLFNPAKRHMDEEKQRLQSTREEAGDASDGKRIDLGTGKVTIRRKAAEAAEDTDSDDADEAEAEETEDEPEIASGPAAGDSADAGDQK